MENSTGDNTSTLIEVAHESPAFGSGQHMVFVLPACNARQVFHLWLVVQIQAIAGVKKTSHVDHSCSDIDSEGIPPCRNEPYETESLKLPITRVELEISTVPLVGVHR